MILVRVRDEDRVKRTIRNRSIMRERCFTLLFRMQPRVKHQFLTRQLQEIRIRANLGLPGQINKSHSLLCEIQVRRNFPRSATSPNLVNSRLETKSNVMGSLNVISDSNRSMGF